MECELLRNPMISYRSLLYNTTVLYDKQGWLLGRGNIEVRHKTCNGQYLRTVVLISAVVDLLILCCKNALGL